MTIPARETKRETDAKWHEELKEALANRGLAIIPLKRVDDLVDRFLTWPLPESVCSDLCATERGYPHRTGTNLLTATEARQMIEHLFAAALAEKKHIAIGHSSGSVGRLAAAIEWVEANAPLPRCQHGAALRDGAGEILEPRCGCRWPKDHAPGVNALTPRSAT